MNEKATCVNTSGISDIIGTLLLLLIAISLFSVVYMFVLSYPVSTQAPSANIAWRVDGGTITFEHCGGKGLDLNTNIMIKSGDESPVQLIVKDYLDNKAKSDNLWGVSEKITYSSDDILGNEIEVNVIDIITNSMIMTGVCDIQDQNFTLEINIIGNGDVTVNPNNPTYSYGDTVDLTATANSGWIFTGWSGDLTGTQASQEITMDTSKTITAIFSQETFTLDTNTIGNGAISKNPNQQYYYANDEVILTANPDDGWSFAGWSGDISGTNNPETITMDENKDVTATFSLEAYTLTVTSDGSGSGTTEYSPQGPYSYNDEVTVWANATLDSVFDGWSGDISGDSSPVTITMDSSKSITATFLSHFILTTSTVGDGTLSINPPGGTYIDGTTVELSANPEADWIFDSWSGDLTGDTNPDTITMDIDKTITCTFIEDNRMHVESIDMSIKNWGVWKQAEATITIVDSEGDVVKDALVSGEWSGLTNDEDADETKGNGKVTMDSDWVYYWESGTFIFTITDVTLDGWVYDSSANEQTSGSIST